MQREERDIGLAQENVEQLAAELTTAKSEITALRSELASKQAALSRLLADDLRTCDELAVLQKIIWGYHRGLPGGCDCMVCDEVERGQRELDGLI